MTAADAGSGATLLRTAWGVATAVGRRRGNEDSYLAEPPLFLVADGMGGHEAGEVASALAVEAFRDLLGRPAVSVTELAARLDSAGRRVHEIPAASGLEPGTTVAGVAIGEQDGAPYWLVLNVGDSRVYRLAGGELTQISVDHSEVQEMLDQGEISPDQAHVYSRRNVITRALGPQGPVEPDFWLLPAALHDRMLICSDGLTGELSDAQISTVLLAEPDPQEVARLLVREALSAGGHDNVTVVVVDAMHVSGAESDPSTIPSRRSHDPDDDNGDTLPRGLAVQPGAPGPDDPGAGPGDAGPGDAGPGDAGPGDASPADASPADADGAP